MLKVLFLTPWYPSEKDAMAGLFVQKHVEAVRAQGCDVRVIDATTWSGIWRAWRALQREKWMPDVVQLNVIQKQGLLALWLKKRYGIPYVIVEHWSGYLPENGAFMKMSKPQREMYKRIAQGAEIILTVSGKHAEAMKACGIQNKRWGRIDNVVDDFFFEVSKSRNLEVPKKDKILLHVSCFDEKAKNVKGLLRAAKMLSERRKDWRLVLVGTGIDYQEVRAYAESLNIPDCLLVWTGELTPCQVAEEFDKADAFVLPSNYENAPVVISESLVKGVPIISSYVGGIPEMVNEQCGVLVPTGDDKALTQALDTMLDHYQEYDARDIRSYGRRYAFATVGRNLKEIYEDVCG